MKNSFYYKIDTEEGTKYYGLKVLTEDMEQIDEILDQILLTEGIFISEEEFNNNIKVPMTLNVKDFETETKTVATLTFEEIDLTDLSEDKEIIL